MTNTRNPSAVFHEGNPAGERKTRRVVLLTATMSWISAYGASRKVNMPARCALSLHTPSHLATSSSWLSVHDELHHVTVEVNAPERPSQHTAASGAR